MGIAMKVTNLSKNFGGVEAVKGISFEIRTNEIFALIGPNGAGKTTTLRIVATILEATGGDVSVGGISVRQHPDKVREIISYLPEEAGAYKNLTGMNYLRFMASIYTSDNKKQDEFVDTAVEITGLKDRLKDRIGTYSKGMTRKLLLARAIMTKPRLAILDEPTSGLDVINALEIRRTIKQYAHEGMTVLVSSHNMLEIEFLSDRVAIIDKGRIHEIGAPAELKDRYGAGNLEEVFAKVTGGLK